MKIKLPKIKKIKLNFSLFYVYTFIALFSISVVAFLSWFLYENFYKTITQSEQIILLRQEVAPDTINTQRVNKVLNSLAKKTNVNKIIEWTSIKNPFSKSLTENTEPPVSQ